MRRIAVFSLLLFATLNLTAQDVEQGYNSLRDRIKNDPIKVTGMFSGFGQYYNTTNNNQRALPFSGRLMAGVNFDILGVKAPFSMFMSSGGELFNYKLPSYVFAGISPSYKWAKLHLGNRTMAFDKYTFSGQSFDGIGLELTPSKWTIKTFYGRLRRARIEDVNTIQRLEPIYKRLGAGVQAGFEDNGNKLLLSLFKGWDEPNSIPQPDSSFTVFPSENTIISLDGEKKIGKNLNLKVNYAISGLTENVNSPIAIQANFLQSYAGLLNTNVSSRWNDALNTELIYRIGKNSISAGYEKVDPGYRTLGSLYFNDDIENFTLGTRFNLLKNKINLNLKGGLQRNNLANDQKNQYNRFVGSAIALWRITKTLNLNLNYSSFNSTNIRHSLIDPFNPIPISELVLNNQNANAGLSYSFPTNERSSSIIQTNVSYAKGRSIINDTIQDNSQTDTYMIFGYYGLDLFGPALNTGITYSYTLNQLGYLKASSNSFGLILNKELIKEKLGLSVQSSFSNNRQERINENDVAANLWNASISLNYSISKKSSLMFIGNYLQNKPIDNPLAQEFSEIRCSVNYRIRLGRK